MIGRSMASKTHRSGEAAEVGSSLQERSFLLGRTGHPSLGWAFPPSYGWRGEVIETSNGQGRINSCVPSTRQRRFHSKYRLVLSLLWGPACQENFNALSTSSKTLRHVLGITQDVHQISLPGSKHTTPANVIRQQTSNRGALTS